MKLLMSFIFAIALGCSQQPGQLNLAKTFSKAEKACYKINASTLSTASLKNVVIPDGLDVSNLNTSGQDMENADFSKAKGLTAFQLNAASDIRFIKLPPNMDMSGFNGAGKDLQGIDFSQTRNLSASSLSGATSIQQIKLPDGFDLTGLDTTGMNIYGVDFTNTTGLTTAMLNSAVNIRAIIFPPGFDMTGFSPAGKNILYTDFSQTTNFTAQMLNEADYNHESSPPPIIPPGLDVSTLDLTGIKTKIDLSQSTGLTIEILDTAERFLGKIPPGLDVSNLDIGNSYTGSVGNPYPKYRKVDFSQAIGFDLDIYLALARCNFNSHRPWERSFSNCNTLPPFDVGSETFTSQTLASMHLPNLVNFTGAHISEADGIERVTLPSNVDFSSYTGAAYLLESDLSTVQNMTSAMINSTDYLNYSILPPMDFTGVNKDFDRLDGADLRNVTNLSVAQVNNFSNSLESIWFPNGFNVSGVNFANSRFEDVDLSNVVGMTSSQVYQILDTILVKNVKFPAVDLTGITSPTGKPLTDIDFSLCTNFEVDLLNGATSIWGAKIPDGTDLSGLSLSSYQYIDLSNGVNFPPSMVNYIRSDYVPAGTDFSLYDPSIADSGTYTNTNYYGVKYTWMPDYSVAQINSFTDIHKVTLDSGFDLAGFDPSGMGSVEHFNIYDAVNFPISALNAGVDFTYFTPPKDFDISGWDSTGKTMKGWDLREVVGLTGEHLKNATDISDIKLPADFDYRGVDFGGKTIHDLSIQNLPEVSCD